MVKRFARGRMDLIRFDDCIMKKRILNNVYTI